MSQRRIILPVLAAAVAFPASAAAAGGNGLYEPFPEPAVRKAAGDFARRASLNLSASALAAGRFLGADGARLETTSTVGPGRRAGVGAGSSGSLAWPAGAGLLVVAVAGAAAVRRRVIAT